MYLDEEVTDQATSLQRDSLKAGTHIPGGEDEEGLELENATLKWNEVGVEKQEE